MCSKCKKGGAPTFNFSHQERCFGCKVEKGKCFLKDAPPKKTLAERQVEQEKKDKKKRSKGSPPGKEQAKRVADAVVARKLEEKKVAKLEQELAEVKSLLKNQAGAGEVQMEVDEAEEEASDSIEQLQKLRLFLIKEMGRAEDHLDVQHLDDKIKAKKEANLAGKEGHVQLLRAEKEVKQCRASLSKAEAAGKALQEELEQLQTKMAQAESAQQKAALALGEAEKKRDGVLAGLRKADPEPGPGESLESAKQFLALVPEEELSGLGVTKDGLAVALSGLQKLASQRGEKAKEDASRHQETIKAQEAANAEALRAKEAASAAATAEAKAKAEREAANQVGLDAKPAVDAPGGVPNAVGGSSPRELSVEDALGLWGDEEFKGIDEGIRKRMAEKLIKARSKPY